MLHQISISDLQGLALQAFDKIAESLYNSVMIQQLINDEKFTNVQTAQAGITKLFNQASHGNHFYRVMKNDTPLGVLIPNDLWEDLTEELELLSSPTYLKIISEARDEVKAGSTLSLAEVKKQLGL